MSSRSISSASNSSAFSFCHLTSSLDDVPFCSSNVDDFGGTAHSSVVVERLSTFENARKRDLRIQVPELKQQSYPLPLPPGATPNSNSQENPWKKGQLIYKGILGGIYHGFNCENGGMCAMKEVPLSSHGDKNQSARMLEKEIALLSRMRHPNIVQYYGSEMVDGKFCIYYEYMSRGSIYMILEQYGRLGESAIRSYTQHILSGLAYMHSKSIAHGDIKGANILLDPNGRVKLTNFGIEKQIAEKFHLSWLMDSPYWIAPEVIMNPNVRNPAVDIWSLGCTVLEMATSKPPLSQYEGVMAMFKVAYHKELPTIPDHLSDDCKDFLRHCLQWNPLHRPTAFQLLEHPFVKRLSPSRERILVSASSNHPAVANYVKPEGRNPHELDSGKVVSGSDFGPRNILVGSPLLQQLSRRKSTPIGGGGSGSCIHLNQSTSRDFPKQSPNSPLLGSKHSPRARDVPAPLIG